MHKWQKVYLVSILRTFLVQGMAQDQTKKVKAGQQKGKPNPKAESSFSRSKPELQLLQNIDGVFAPGVMTALMGSTGAGKTTLMDVLAGRKTGEENDHYS